MSSFKKMSMQMIYQKKKIEVHLRLKSILTNKCLSQLIPTRTSEQSPILVIASNDSLNTSPLFIYIPLIPLLFLIHPSMSPNKSPGFPLLTWYFIVCLSSRREMFRANILLHPFALELRFARNFGNIQQVDH